MDTSPTHPKIDSPEVPRPTVDDDIVVLIVDDDKRIRNVIRTFLMRATNARVLVASGPRAAMALALSVDRAMDVVISDVDLKAEIDGIQLAVDIAAMMPTAKIVLMSGAERKLELRPGWKFIAKPFALAELIEALAGVFDVPSPTSRPVSA